MPRAGRNHAWDGGFPRIRTGNRAGMTGWVAGGADVTLTRIVIAALLEAVLLGVLIACARLIGR
jgi:hypothetical protein